MAHNTVLEENCITSNQTPHICLVKNWTQNALEQSGEILLEYDSDSCPSIQLVSDSEEDSEDETEKKFLLFSERLGVMMDSLFKNKLHFKGATTLRKSSKKIKWPPHTEEENKCFVAKMKLHYLEAYVLLDLGCTTDSLTRVHNVSKFESPQTGRTSAITVRHYWQLFKDPLWTLHQFQNQWSREHPLL
jgi:hypothetical protein